MVYFSSQVKRDARRLVQASNEQVVSNMSQKDKW